MEDGFKAINLPSCGLDIHKDIIEATVIDAEGKQHYKTFDTMRNSLYALRDWILSKKCFAVLMESTGVYWIPIYEILEEVNGMDVGLGNSSHMKNVPGRPKTDKEDSRWIARLCMMGLILKNFVVGREFRGLREITRYHKKLVQERARILNRIEKLLQLNGFKLSSVISKIDGVSGLRFLKKLQTQGFVTVQDVNQLRAHNLCAKSEDIERAINGNLKLISRLLLGKMLSRLETLDKEIAEIYDLMVEHSKNHASAISIIDSIPGLAELSAIYMIAEIGTDLSSFKSANHLTAWAGLAPKIKESAGKQKSSKTKKANVYVKSILVECAWGAVRTRNTRLSNWYWRNKNRLGEKTAITAVARKLLVYIYAMLNSGELYNDSLDVADTEIYKAQKLPSARKTVEHHTNNSNAKKQCANKTKSDLVNALPAAQAYQNSPNIAASEATPRKRGRPRKKKDTDDLAANLTA